MSGRKKKTEPEVQISLNQHELFMAYHTLEVGLLQALVVNKTKKGSYAKCELRLIRNVIKKINTHRDFMLLGKYEKIKSKAKAQTN